MPEHDDCKLYEFLVLEGAQAGLSWETILTKRKAYQKALAGFDPKQVAHFGNREINRMMSNAGLVRNRLKLESAVRNAQAVLEVQREFGSLDSYLWGLVGGEPTVNHWRTSAEVPTSTADSKAMSKALKSRGFSFVGPTICYAFMQAVGMVNDHLVDCPRHAAFYRERQKRRFDT